MPGLTQGRERVCCTVWGPEGQRIFYALPNTAKFFILDNGALLMGRPTPEPVLECTAMYSPIGCVKNFVHHIKIDETRKSGRIRMCIDLREPNKAVTVDSFPLPHMDAFFTEGCYCVFNN
ncbi:hypothetical protein MHYP_G00083980 [Metynnis hypsauchen]